MSKKLISPTAPSPETANGFGEAPQAAFAGAPLSGSISDWAQEIADASEKLPDPAPVQTEAAAAPARKDRQRPARSPRRLVDRQRPRPAGRDVLAGVDEAVSSERQKRRENL
jgi:excinuclease ABC subunit B